VIYALLSAVGWSSLDALRKQLTGEMSALAVATWLNAGFAPFFLLWAVSSGEGLPAAGYAPLLAVAIAVSLLGQLLYLKALEWSGLGAVIPMLALTPALSSLMAAVALGELPAPAQLTGLGLIVAGCLANGLLSGHGPRLDRGAAAMAVVAVLWAGSGVIDKAAVTLSSPAVHAASTTLLSVPVLLAVLAMRGQLRELVPPAGARRTLPAAVVVLGLAYGCQLMAYQHVLVGVVEGTKRGLGMPLAMLNGWWFFGETLDPRRIVAVVAIVLGVGLLV
jgi:drug/metabolite transporter (DMT)-like permease